MSKKKITSKLTRAGLPTNPSWKDADKALKDVLEYYRNNYAMLSSIVETYKETIEADKELNQIITGVLFSYQDIVKDLRYCMEQHITYEYMIFKNYDIKDIKSGKEDYDKIVSEHPEFGNEIRRRVNKINMKSNEYFSYVNTVGLYMDIYNRLVNMNSYLYINIFSKLKAFNTEENKNLIENLTQTKDLTVALDKTINENILGRESNGQ